MQLVPWRTKKENRETTEMAPLNRLRQEMDSLFEQYFREPMSLFNEFPSGFGGSVGIPVDMSETDDEVTVKVELPGVDPKDVDINVSGNLLTIRGEKKQESEEKKRNYHYVERYFGRFQRSIQLPHTVDPDKVDAAYKNGILTVRVAKNPAAKPKRINVKET